MNIQDGRSCLRCWLSLCDGDSLCEFCCLHMDRAWTGPRSLTGWQACLLANLGQLRWRLEVVLGGAAMREVSCFDKGREDSQGSYCEPIAAALLNSHFFSFCHLQLPYFSKIYCQTRTQRQVSQASRDRMSEFMVWTFGDLFFFFQILCENPLKD